MDLLYAGYMCGGKERETVFKGDFQKSVFHTFNIVYCFFYCQSAKESKHAWSLVGANIAETTLWDAKKQLMSFS